MSHEMLDEEPQAPLPNILIRFVQVIVAPAALFDALKERPAWLDALLVTIVVGLLIQFMIPAELMREAMMAGLPADAAPEQIEAVEKMADFTSSFGWVLAIVSTVFLFAFLAGVLKLIYGIGQQVCNAMVELGCGCDGTDTDFDCERGISPVDGLQFCHIVFEELCTASPVDDRVPSRIQPIGVAAN